MRDSPRRPPAIGNERARLRLRTGSKLAAEGLIDLRRVRLPAGHLHDLSDEEPEDFHLPEIWYLP